MGKESEVNRDWTEDFSLENGNYQNRCVKCGELFMGYKRRVVCKLCSAPKQQSIEEEFKWLSKERDAELCKPIDWNKSQSIEEAYKIYKRSMEEKEIYGWEEGAFIAGARSQAVKIEELEATIKRRAQKIAMQDKEIVTLMKRVEELEQFKQEKS